jgi:hypothetical protein
MFSKTLVNKMKNNWKPYCKLNTDEKDLIDRIPADKRVRWSYSKEINWVLDKVEGGAGVKLEAGRVYRLHEDYTPFTQEEVDKLKLNWKPYKDLTSKEKEILEYVGVRNCQHYAPNEAGFRDENIPTYLRKGWIYRIKESYKI